MTKDHEPFGWVAADEVAKHFQLANCGTIYRHSGEGRVPLYTAPREWQGLTDEEINKLRYKKDWTAPWTDMTFARAIERAHGIGGNDEFGEKK